MSTVASGLRVGNNYDIPVKPQETVTLNTGKKVRRVIRDTGDSTTRDLLCQGAGLKKIRPIYLPRSNDTLPIKFRYSNSDDEI